MTTPLDQTRAEFEAHRMSRNGGRRPQKWGECAELFGLEMPVGKTRDDYVSRADQGAWEAWQAAIASRAAGWLPIETAPKDQTHVRMYCPNSRRSTVAEGSILVRPDGESWTFGGHTWFPSVYPDIPTPTHWMPLPAPPTPQDPPIAAKAAKETPQ